MIHLLKFFTLLFKFLLPVFNVERGLFYSEKWKTRGKFVLEELLPAVAIDVSCLDYEVLCLIRPSHDPNLLHSED